MKKPWIKNIFLFFLIIFFHQMILKNVYAVRYSLIAPSGTLTRGQTVTFTINIDTQGETISNAAIGMTYETQYLEYVNTIAGNAFPNLTTTPQEGGKLIFQATSSQFNGSGTFAQVNFKIIAQAPGETQLCVLWEVPQETITPQPTNISQNTPTKIPTSGQGQPASLGLIVGSIFTIGAIGTLTINKKIFKFKSPLRKNSFDKNRNKQPQL